MMRSWSQFALVPLIAVLGCSPPPGDTSNGTGSGSSSSGGHSMPPDYVMTPNGWTHAACLYEIKPGQELTPSGMIIQADGSVLGVDKCTHPSYDLDGKEIIVSPIANTW